MNQFSQRLVNIRQVDKKYGRMLALVMQTCEANNYSPKISVSPKNAAVIVTNAEEFVAKIKTLLNH